MERQLTGYQPMPRKFALRRGLVPAEATEPAKIEDATIKGDKLSFQVTPTRNDQGFTVVYEGNVSEEGIKGLKKQSRLVKQPM